MRCIFLLVVVCTCSLAAYSAELAQPAEAGQQLRCEAQEPGAQGKMEQGAHEYLEVLHVDEKTAGKIQTWPEISTLWDRSRWN